MSRIGKMPIAIPNGVEINISGSTVTVKGKGGELTRTFQDVIDIKHEGEEIVCSPKNEEQQTNAYWGLTRTLLANMVTGVNEGFEKKLELVGVGYRAALKGSDIELTVGYSHPVLVKCPEGITFEVPEADKITVKGASKEQVGQVAADIRKWRKPEPYKGKGIRYEGEYVRRKAGKAGKE
jgi:large subunit ribosomal protein L6